MDLCIVAVCGLHPWDGLGTGTPYSRAGSRCVRDEQCVCRPSRRPLGAALQSGRNDAVAGTSAHGRSHDFRRGNRLHQSDGRDGNGRSERECGVASSRTYIYHGKLEGSRVDGPGRPLCRNWSDCALWLADSLAERWAVQDGGDVRYVTAFGYQTDPRLQGNGEPFARAGCGYLYVQRTRRRGAYREAVGLARGPRDSSRIECRAVRQRHRGWFQRQPVVYSLAQRGWEAIGQHRYRLPQPSDLALERRIIGEWSRSVRCESHPGLTASYYWSDRDLADSDERTGMEIGDGHRLCRMEVRSESRSHVGERCDDRAAAELAEHLCGDAGNRIQVVGA